MRSPRSPRALLAAAAGLFAPSIALDNGVARTPDRGWNSWNTFKCGWTEQTIYATADAFVSTGLAAAGYDYINLDGCELAPCPADMNNSACHNFTRDAAGVLHDVDAARLPRGAKAACDYIHGKGLKCGGYSDAAYVTCQNRPGSLFYETQDAQMWADIGLDLFKVDNCGEVPPGWEKPERRYPPLRDALNATGRPILFSLCVWGTDEPWLWGPSVGNTWRIWEDSDICDHSPGFGNGCWKHVMDIADVAVGLGKYAGPGAWNDLDILMVANGGMTPAEDESHFFLWVVAKSPLLLGNDVTLMDPQTLALLTSPDVLSVSADALGVAGDLVNRTCLVGGVEQACSGGGGGGGGSYPVVYAAPCAAAGSAGLTTQVFNISAAPYANASGSEVIRNLADGECVALWDCAAPVVHFDCAADAGSCSGAGMEHFRWVRAPLADDGSFQLRSVMLPSQCLGVAAGALATADCAADGPAWSLSALGQLVEAASGLCADTASNASEPVDTWAAPLAGGDRAVLLLNRRAAPANITADFASLGLDGEAAVRDLFPSMPLGTARGSFTAEVEPHGALLMRLSPVTKGGGSDSGGGDDGWRPQPPAAAAARADRMRKSAAAAARVHRRRG